MSFIRYIRYLTGEAMNLKAKESHVMHPASGTKDSLNFSGGGRVAVSVVSIVSSPKVQRQVAAVKEIAASQEAVKRR